MVVKERQRGRLPLLWNSRSEIYIGVRAVHRYVLVSLPFLIGKERSSLWVFRLLIALSLYHAV